MFHSDLLSAGVVVSLVCPNGSWTGRLFFSWCDIGCVHEFVCPAGIRAGLERDSPRGGVSSSCIAYVHELPCPTGSRGGHDGYVSVHEFPCPNGSAGLEGACPAGAGSRGVSVHEFPCPNGRAGLECECPADAGARGEYFCPAGYPTELFSSELNYGLEPNTTGNGTEPECACEERACPAGSAGYGSDGALSGGSWVFQAKVIKDSLPQERYLNRRDVQAIRVAIVRMEQEDAVCHEEGCGRPTRRSLLCDDCRRPTCRDHLWRTRFGTLCPCCILVRLGQLFGRQPSKESRRRLRNGPGGNIPACGKAGRRRFPLPVLHPQGQLVPASCGVDQPSTCRRQG